MYTTLEAREVETFGAQETRDYSIKASGKAFKILINNLYADKPLAVTRELWSNAYDSHAAAGKADVPFDVHLPTAFDPYFSVRDYGVSLTHDGVMSIYSTLFESTKEDDNNSVGKLGLGAKSPFAYTDTFMLTAWLNGEKRIYNAVINAKSIPQIMHVSTEASDEPQGVEVSFPVKPDDVDLFERAALRVVRGFECVPRFTSGTLNIPVVTASLVDPTGNNRWKLLHNDTVIQRGARALQGCVIYPIDANAISDLTPAEQAILRLPLLINFPIGQLDITPSRESLSYDEFTQANIRTMVQEITKAITQTYVDKVKSETSYWQACSLFSKLVTTATEIPDLEKILGENTTYKTRRLVQRISLNKFMERYGKSHMLGGIAMTKVENAALWNQRRSPKWEPTSYCYVQPRTDVVVLEDPNDNLNNVGPRLQYGAECNRLGNGSVLWVKADPNSAAWARLYAYLGRPPVVRVNEAELPKRPKGVKGATSRPKTMMKTVKFSSYAEQDTLVDAQASHFYVRKDRNLYKRPGVGDTRSLTNIIDLRNQLVSLGFMAETDEIIIVPGTHKKKVERPNWKCLYTFAARMVDEKMNVREINRGLALELYLNSLCDVGEYLKHRLARPEPMTYAPGSAAANYAAHIADCQRRFARRDMQGKLRTLATTLRHPKNMEIKVGRDIDDTPFQVAFADAYPLVHDHMKYASTNASAVNDDMITKVDRTINALDLLAAQAQGGTDDAQSADIAA